MLAAGTYQINVGNTVVRVRNADTGKGIAVMFAVPARCRQECGRRRSEALVRVRWIELRADFALEWRGCVRGGSRIAGFGGKRDGGDPSREPDRRQDGIAKRKQDGRRAGDTAAPVVCLGSISGAKLVARRTLDVVDDQKWERGFNGLQFQTKLLPQGFHEGRALELGSGIGIGLGGASGFRRELNGEIEAAGQAGPVHYGVIQPAHSRECAGEQGHRDVARSAFGNMSGLMSA